MASTIAQAAPTAAAVHALTPSAPAVHVAPAPARLPDQITVQHGPAAPLSRFFLLADSAARERGVLLSLAPLQELLAVNRPNASTSKPLPSMFYPPIRGIYHD